MDENEGGNRQRPAEEDEHAVEALVGDFQARGVAHEVDAEQRIDDRLDRQRHELQRLEGLVRKRVPAHLGERTELLKDQNARAEIEVRQEEREREGKCERQPALDEREVQAEPDSPEAEHADHRERVRDHDDLRGDIGPDEKGDTSVASRAGEDEPALDQDLGHDRDGVELGPADGVEGVAQEVCVAGRDQERAARHDQAREACTEAERQREDNRGQRGKREPEHDQGAQVVANRAPVARRLARVQRSEAEVGEHGDEARVGDQGGVAAVVGVAE